MEFPRTIKQHQANVRSLRCLISANPAATIHHCHGGSMKDAGYHSGMAERGVSEALIIPIKADFHFGDEGIDYGVGVLTWEKYYGTQMDFLAEAGEKLGYDFFRLHEKWIKQAPIRG